MSDLIKIGKAITDFREDEDDFNNNNNNNNNDDKEKKLKDGTSDDIHIPVVFNEGEDEDDEEFVPEIGDEEDDEEKDDEEIIGKDTEMTDSLIQKKDEKQNEDSSLDLNPRDIGAYWLQKELSKFFNDPLQSQKITSDILDVLSKSTSQDRDCENDLVNILDFDRFDFIKLLLKNRWKIVYCTKLGRAQNDIEKNKIEEEMKSDQKLSIILQSLKGKSNESNKSEFSKGLSKEVFNLSRNKEKISKQSQSQQLQQQDNMKITSTSAEIFSVEHRNHSVLDLDSLSFNQGGHLMTNKQCKLPPGSFRQSKKGYEEVHVPGLKSPPFSSDESLIKISSLPEWAQKGFDGVKTLNRIQSRLYKASFEGHDNLLICAPTGSGKTNVAMLTMLHTIGLYMDQKSKIVSLDQFKIVYVAPMKSLVQEMVFNFGKRLKEYGITVRELTGDQALTKQQISETQVIVTTPEKWDIITRKTGDRTYTQLLN